MTEQEALQRSIEHLHGPEEIPYGGDEIVVVCIVRDGRPYVKSFVDHYSSLGAKHIAFLDNNSADGTVEALRNYENVTVLRTKLPYKATGTTTGNSWTREVLFKQYMISRFGGKNRWCLCVDIDELFDYPYSDVVNVSSFLRYLNSKSYTAVAAQMLDMISGEPLSGRAINEDESLKALYTYFDVSNIKRKPLKGRARRRNNTLGNEEIESFSGGIRDTIFGTAPYLTKFPLVFLDGRVKPMDGSSHRISNAAIADITGVLFHYKFVDRHFHEQVAQAVREEHRLRNSAVYKRYQEVLSGGASLQMKRDTAREIESVNDLLECQFLVVSRDYLSWVDAEEEKNVSHVPLGSTDFIGAVLEARRRERAKTLEVQKLSRQLREERIGHADAKGSNDMWPSSGEDDGGITARRDRDPGSGREPGSDTDRAAASTTEARWKPSGLSENVRPLFVAGCARSGTTAVTDYLNRHPEILVCQERYKTGVSTTKITRELFSFERILDFKSKETERPPWPVERFVKYHEDMLARKDPAGLRWVGDKGPWYVRYMDVLTENNPGARFLILYRPLEEVAESWKARAEDPDDPWSQERGIEVAVETWNAAMRKTREFTERHPLPRVLIVNYHDFFYRNETVVPQIRRFLNVEFDESLIEAWREASARFEVERRPKRILSEDQRSFIREHADRASERWVLDRIEKQWTNPGLWVEDSREAALASLEIAEARTWRLQERVGTLERSLARERRRSGRRIEKLVNELKGARRRIRGLESGPTNLHNSRIARLLNKLSGIRAR